MIKNPVLEGQARILMEQLDISAIGQSIQEKYIQSSSEEKKKFDTIRNKMNQYNKAGDTEGLKKYLMHIRTKL